MAKRFKPFPYEKSGLPENDGLLRKAFEQAKKDAAGSLEIFFDSVLPLAKMMDKSTAPENRRQATALALLFPSWQEKKRKHDMSDFSAAFGEAVERDLKKLSEIYANQQATHDDFLALTPAARAVLTGAVLAAIEQDIAEMQEQDMPERWEWLADMATKLRNLMPSDPQIDCLGAQLMEMAAQTLGLNFRFYFSPDKKLSFDTTPPPECVTTAKKSWVPN